MYVKCRQSLLYVTACTLLQAAAAPLVAAELQVTVLQAQGATLPNAVIDVQPQTPQPAARTAARAVMDQRDLMFVPDTLAIRTGTTVEFPNSDNVRHQVYSFSAPKNFQLSLYDSKQHASVVFDKPGLVTVGCNIHDAMIGYIYVTDSPWFGQTSANGSLQLHNVPAGQYTVKVWHARLRDKPESLSQPLELAASGGVVTIRLKQALKPAQHNHGSSKQWEDY
jgi:plastocyanin